MSKSDQKGSRECPVCYPANDEIVSIMFKLATKINNEYQQFLNLKKFTLPNYQAKTQSNPDPLLSLINFIFNSILPANSICQHQIVYLFLENKTQLKRTEIAFISQSIYQFQAKRNYSLEVLSAQIKNFYKTIPEDLNRKNALTSSNPQNSKCPVKIEQEPFPIEQMPSQASKVGFNQEINPNTIFVPMYIERFHPVHFGYTYNPLN